MPSLGYRTFNPGNVSLPIPGWSGGGFVDAGGNQAGHGTFSSFDQGIAALNQRLQVFQDRGFMSIQDIGLSGKYEVPATASWGQDVSNFSGLSLTAPLNLNDPVQQALVDFGISAHESQLSTANIALGYSPGQSAADTRSDISQDYAPGGNPPADISGTTSDIPTPSPRPSDIGSGSLNSITTMTPDQAAANDPGSTAAATPGDTTGPYSPQATGGLPGPFGAILGGGTPNVAAAQTGFTPGQVQAQAKTPASTEGQIAQAKATEDEAKSVAKAADTEAKATNALAKQQAQTGQQASDTAAQDTKTSTGSNADIANTALGTFRDITQRSFIAIFGFILLAGGVYYFSRQSGSSYAPAAA